MKTKPLIIGCILLGVGLIIGRFLAPGSAAPEPFAAEAPKPTAETVWTCSMHPQIQQSAPGACPICGMDLIPLSDSSTADDSPLEISMSDRARVLAEIETTLVERTFPNKSIRLVGKLTYDETKEKSLTIRFPARIEKLFVNYTGVTVNQGEHLAEVYSPELLTAQRELISSYQRDPNSRITSIAREKLRLWDLLPEQIEATLRSGVPADRFELKAPTSGVVVQKMVNEGDYVKTGEPLFQIVDLSSLWLTLSAYESDLFWLRYGQDVTFTVEAYPGESFSGKISFIEPELNSETRTIPIRVTVPNAEGRLKPGMLVRGEVESRLTESGKVYAPDLAGKWISPMHPQIIKEGPGACDVCGMDLVPADTLGYAGKSYPEAPVVVPSTAVLRTGKRAVVYIEVPDKERPTYLGREIVLGPKAGDVFIVESGIEAGERVVTNGAFKIDSALQIKAKPSMMSQSGEALEVLSVEATNSLLPYYLELQAALAGDDLTAAKKAVELLHTHWADGPMDLLMPIMQADSLDAIRRPWFESISSIFTQAVTQPAFTTKSAIYIMNCPMVYEDRGADWLQSSDELRNPYFGASMLYCGSTKETITPEISE